MTNILKQFYERIVKKDTPEWSAEPLFSDKILEHKHMIIRAEIKNPPKSVDDINKWMTDLVNKIGMKILMGPYSVYSDMPGNRGLTAVTIIETSHIALHCWDECTPALLQLDVYTCSKLDVEIVKKHLTKFKPTSIEYVVYDRENNLEKLV